MLGMVMYIVYWGHLPIKSVTEMNDTSGSDGHPATFTSCAKWPICDDDMAQ